MNKIVLLTRNFLVQLIYFHGITYSTPHTVEDEHSVPSSCTLTDFKYPKASKKSYAVTNVSSGLLEASDKKEDNLLCIFINRCMKLFIC